ncbi:HEAT repeat protein [Paecilomyces variotii No. 5]|uniref:HEAT repeat protein n=1 Tax=Byssochlamys spectabilis (strain No. 5 / NBRC 109023) TaxID=1356009 RepID=V5I0W3_BYSSN|nr:HEAT repeat protein [Paecilomyces variotii No. 5]
MAETGWAEMDSISQNIQILPADTLIRICRGPLVKFALECENDQKVVSIWQCLLQTFADASTSASHTTTTCNAVSGFLDAALVSKNHETRQIALSRETWLAVFEVYVDRFEDAKPKPMKQVLNSLLKILGKYSNTSEVEALLLQAGEMILPSIIIGEPRSRLKVSLLSLEIFIRKNAISPSQLMSMVSKWLANHGDRWRPVFDQHHGAWLSGSSMDGVQDEDNGHINVARIFTLALLIRATSAEVASASGAVLAALFQKIKAALPSTQNIYLDPTNSLPLWVAPAKQIMLRNMDSLDIMSNHMLSPLFTVDSAGFRSFIYQLPIQILLSGDMTEAPLDQFSLLFSALQIGKKVGLVHEDGKHRNRRAALATSCTADKNLGVFGKASGAKNDKDVTLVIKSEILGQFLLHREASIRVAALSLLITASSTTKPISSDALRAILLGLPALHADSDAQSRGHILTLTRRLLVRLRSGTQKSDQHVKAVASGEDDNIRPLKRRRSLDQSTDVEQSRFDSRAFLEHYLSFLEGDLEPTASYQRHIMALKALSLILQSRLDPRVNAPPIIKSEKDVLPWRFSLDILRPHLLRLLVDLLLDPFEEVRATSLSVLAMFPLESSQTVSRHNEKSPISQLTEALMKAEHLASSTSRADHADAVARLYHVVFSLAGPGSGTSPDHWYGSKNGVVNFILKKLEEKLSHPGGLFNSAMRDAPLHGYISALRYIVATSNFYSQISGMEDKQIWIAVKPVLCVDSPEGHTDEPIEDLVVGPKDILSYSWRALRESSLLLHATLANPTYAPSQGGLCRTDYEKIGIASFIQLAELRHRGAFSTVSQTFSTCCQRCGESSDPSISSLPTGWYMQARNIIDEQASKLTRRSAGLPALVTGILSSNPGGPLFDQVMKELQDISRLPAAQDDASYEIKLPQVHAMNCLKDIFTDTRLGPHTEPFIMSALRISSECISSQIWAIRNCGLMLFRALLIRMCRSVTGVGLGFGGVSGSESGSRIPFQRYPGLIDLLCGLLTPAREGSDGKVTTVTERVFPALELIGEKVPSVSGDEDHGLRELVLYHTKSPVWAIREHAARVYASLLKLPEITNELGILLNDNASSRQNCLHGKALCLRFGLQRLELSLLGYWNGESSGTNLMPLLADEAIDQLEAIMSTINDVFATMFSIARSEFVQAAILDILNDAIEKSIESSSEARMHLYVDPIFDAHDISSRLDHAVGAARLSAEPNSETRASSLLRRSLAWTSIMRQALSVTLGADWLTALFSQVSAVDPDAARWLLEQMSRVFGTKAKYKTKLMELCTYVITRPFPEYVKAGAMTTMATLLEGLLETDFSGASDLELSWDALRCSIKADYDAYAQSRETTDAALRLQGWVLMLQARGIGAWESSGDFTLQLREWAVKLRYAMKEETEFTTRYSAVMSLSSFSGALRSQAGSPKTPSAAIDIYLILYDMLNDDDEELREISAAVASQLLSYSSVSPERAVAVAPLTASKLLAEFIKTHYKCSRHLFRDAVRRVVGQPISSAAGGPQRRLVPVSQIASEYLKESTVLFVEEKQNLYIDDIREIKVWTGVLFGLEANASDHTILQEFSGWVTEGLSYFTKLALSSNDGLLGWASKTDMFVLGMRVLSASKFLMSQTSMALGHLEEDRLLLKEHMQSFLEAGRSANLHADWLSKLESSSALQRKQPDASYLIERQQNTILDKTRVHTNLTMISSVVIVIILALIAVLAVISVCAMHAILFHDWFGVYPPHHRKLLQLFRKIKNLAKRGNADPQQPGAAGDATTQRLVVPEGTRRTEDGAPRDFVASTAV